VQGSPTTTADPAVETRTLAALRRRRNFFGALAVALLGIMVLAGVADLVSTDSRVDTFAVGAPARLSANLDVSGEMDVRRGSNDAIRVEATLRGAWRVDYRVTQAGETVELDVDRTALAWVVGGFPSAQIRVTVPAATEVTLETHRGSLALEGVEGASALRTSHGDIRVQHVRGALDASARHGAVEIADLVGSARVHSRHGDVTVRDAKGAFDVSTRHGAISLGAELLPGGRSRLETRNGSVAVRLLGSPNVRFEAWSRNGKVTSRFRSDEASRLSIPRGRRRAETAVSGTIGRGEAELVIETRNGAVSIE
jgi:hypothetical protein